MLSILMAKARARHGAEQKGLCTYADAVAQERPPSAEGASLPTDDEPFGTELKVDKVERVALAAAAAMPR